MFLIIDKDNEVVTTEDGGRNFKTKDDAEAYVQMLPVGWGAPIRIVAADEWYSLSEQTQPQ